MLTEVKLDWESSENDQIHFNILSYRKWLETHKCKYSIRSDNHFVLNREVLRVNHWNATEYYFCVWWLPVIVYINTNAHVILTYSFPYDLEDILLKNVFVCLFLAALGRLLVGVCGLLTAGLLLLWSTDSRWAGFSGRGSQVLERRLSSRGSRA